MAACLTQYSAVGHWQNCKAITKEQLHHRWGLSKSLILCSDGLQMQHLII